MVTGIIFVVVVARIVIHHDPSRPCRRRRRRSHRHTHHRTQRRRTFSPSLLPILLNFFAGLLNLSSETFHFQFGYAQNLVCSLYRSRFAEIFAD